MKNAANCVNQCELQDTLIIDVSNAHGGPGSLPGPRPVEGRFPSTHEFAMLLASLSRLGRFPAVALDGGADSESDKTWRVASGARVLSLPAPRAFGGRSSDRPPLEARGLGGSSRYPRWLAPRSFTRPQLGRDDPLNLSILLRGGKENNDDSLSKGD